MISRLPTAIKWLVAIALLLLSAWLIFFPLRFQVLAPRLGQPLILQGGQSFDIRIKTSLPYWPQQWQASLHFADQSIPLTIQQQSTEFALQTLRVKLPDDIPDNKYTLQVSAGNKQQTNPGALHIVSHPADSISIIQMADLPTLSASGLGKGDAQLRKIIQETNLINPQLVLFTGDLAYQGSWGQYYQLLKAMDTVNSPLIAAPGNHEYQGWSAFLTLLGQPYHSIVYGNYLIISMNSGHARDQLTYSQLAWLRKTMEKGKGKTIIVQLHHSIHHRKGDRGYLKNNVAPLLALLKEYAVPIVLSGHWHGDSLFDEKGQLRNDSWQFPGTVFAVTTAAGARLRKEYSQSPLHHGYRLIRFDQRQLQNFSYDYDGDGNRDASSSIPYNHLSLQYTDMLTASISNRLNESFEKILLEFRIPLSNKNYQPDEGEIFKRYIDGNEKVIQILTHIDARENKTIHLQEVIK